MTKGCLEGNFRAMLKHSRRHLTYANVTATLALFVALGGSSYAALKITGRDVKNNSLTGRDVRALTTKDVKNGSLLARDLAPGQLPGPIRYVIRWSLGGTIACEGPCGGPIPQTNRAECEPGERATGGGIAMHPDQKADGAVTESQPLSDSPTGPPVAWRGAVRYTPPPEATVIWSPIVYAVCASP